MTEVISDKKRAALKRRLESLGIHESDLTERFVTGRGPGGQKINTSRSAVQLLHGPSGLEVKCQEGRSQASNRFFARRMLAERFEREVLGKKTASERAAEKLRKQKRRRKRRGRSSSPVAPKSNEVPGDEST